MAPYDRLFRTEERHRTLMEENYDCCNRDTKDDRIL